MILFAPQLLYGQGSDTSIVDMQNNVGNDSIDVTKLDNKIESLLLEIDQLSNAELTHEESVLQFHFNLSKNNLESLDAEIRRIKGRQDFYVNYTDYILPMEMVDVKTISTLKSILYSAINKNQKERFIALVLIKTLMNITFYQKDFKTFIKDYSSYKFLFAQDDNEILLRLTEAYIETNQYQQALNIAQSLYESNPDNVQAFLNLTNALRHAKEYAELEYYTDKILVYKDVKSLIHLSIFLYSRGNTVEASSLVYFIDEWIQQALKIDYNYDITTFKWNFNNSNIPITTISDFANIRQMHHAEELDLLATYIEISDEKTSCRFKKYAYISTFSEIEFLYSADETKYMDEKQLKEYTAKIAQQKSILQMLQQNLLNNNCN